MPTRAKGLKKKTIKRDKGVCTVCGLRVKELEIYLLCLKVKNPYVWYKTKELLNVPINESRIAIAHHKVPFYKSGNSMGVENLITRCYWCEQTYHHNPVWPDENLVEFLSEFGRKLA